MSYTAIQSALDTQLAAITGLPVLQLENTRYEPKTGTAWARSTLMPIEPQRLSTDYDLVQGLYQIDLFYPIDKGTTDASTMADTIKAAFPRADVITGTGVVIHIAKSWREVAQPFQQFYQIPIMVQWNCQLDRDA